MLLLSSSCIQKKISEHPQWESNPCLPIAGSVVIPLDYRVSDSNAMLTRDLVPTIDMRTLRLKSHHICNVICYYLVSLLYERSY